MKQNIILAVSIITALNTLLIVYALPKIYPLQGDMNNDGQLTIVDLSILAERVRANNQ